MQLKPLLLVTALAAALVGGCDRDRNNPPAGTGTTTPPSSDSYSSSGSGQTTTPANAGQPSAAERKQGANPVQGQVDPKEGAQHRDFQQKGEARGPTSPETTPPGPKR